MSAKAVAGLVGLELLKGAIAFVEGKALKNALGYATISDVRMWIRQAVAELKTFVSEELQRQLEDLVLRQMESELAGMLNNIDQYASLSENAQKTNRFLLEEVSTFTARLVPRSLQFDQAYFVATVAIAYRFFALYALYQFDKDKGHIDSAKRMVDSAVKQLRLSRNRLSHEMSPEAHFDIVCEEKRYDYYTEEIPTRPPSFSIIRTCFGTRDGRRVTDRYSVDKMYIKDAKTTPRKQVEVALEPLITPMRQEAQDFLEMANTSLSEVIRCYDEMCQKIGKRYTPPADGETDAESVLEIGAVDIPNLIKMPGATVNKAMQ